MLLALTLCLPVNVLCAQNSITFYIPASGVQSESVSNALVKLIAGLDTGGSAITVSSRWHDYQQGIRAGRQGIYLAPPHFAAWAIHKHRFEPIIRLPGSLTYVVAAARNDASVFEMNDLSNLSVCAQQPLNLDYLLVNRAFDNPLLSANIKIVPSVRDEMLRASSSCRGFSLTNNEYESVAARFPDRYIRLQQSVEYKNLVLIADPATARGDQETVAVIESLLISESGRDTLQPWLGNWSSQSSWVPATTDDYPPRNMRVLETFWR